MGACAAYDDEAVKSHGLVVAHHFGEFAFAVVAHHFHLLEGLTGGAEYSSALVEYAREVVPAQKFAFAADESAVAVGYADELNAL